MRDADATYTDIPSVNFFMCNKYLLNCYTMLFKWLWVKHFQNVFLWFVKEMQN